MSLPQFVNIKTSPIKQLGEYKIHGQIGKGKNGLVLLGKKNYEKNFVVLKVPINKNDKKETEDEIRFLYYPKYKKNCEKFYCLMETFLVDQGKVMVLDLLDGVHLEKIVRPKLKEKDKLKFVSKLSKKEKIHFVNNLLKTLIENLQNFHELGLSHGDIHTGNIMYLPKKRKAILVDFGMSCRENYNYLNFFNLAKCNSGYHSYATDEIYKRFNTIKTHQSDDIYALNNIITLDFGQESERFKDIIASVPIFKKWERVFTPDVIISENKRLKMFQNFK